MQTPILDAFGVPSHGKIVLRTRLDNDIDNIQPWSYSKIEWSRLGESPNQFEKLGARRTSEACPVYNCHGLTFGNRRTQVDDSYKTISGILLDDGFDQIPESEVRLGDIVVYYDGEGNAAHSGIVLNKGDLRGPVVGRGKNLQDGQMQIRGNLRSGTCRYSEFAKETEPAGKIAQCTLPVGRMKLNRDRFAEFCAEAFTMEPIDFALGRVPCGAILKDV